MSYDLPTEHKEDAQKLEADGIIELFEIELTTGEKLYLKPHDDVTWQGNTYEGYFIQIEGVGNTADTETYRPKLTVANPDGVFSSLIARGVIDNASVTRKRVLRTAIENDTPAHQAQQWRVTRPASVNRQRVILEMRDMLDGHFFLTPARQFIPPEFPQVSLK